SREPHRRLQYQRAGAAGELNFLFDRKIELPCCDRGMAGAKLSPNGGTPMPRRFAFALAALGLAACASAPAAPQQAFEPFGLLAFGDHGYHMDYFTQEDLDEAPRTVEAFLEEERADWIEDRRPPDEFEPSPVYRLPNGGYVPASGMMPVAQAMRRYCEARACDSA